MNVARRGHGRAESPWVGTVIVGEGFGCAAFTAPTGTDWQCWEAPRTPGPIQAFVVPWLKNKLLQEAGPDRVCELARPGLKFHCWYRPAAGETAGREFPRKWEFLNPNHAGWDNAYSLGTWHACAAAAPRGLPRKAYATCWGRGDYGQLGAPAPDVCVNHGVTTACARSAVRGPALEWQMVDMHGGVTLHAGDLFTCMKAWTDITCWGAARDGFFGDPASCPAELRSAWPTPRGTVTAPHAACSATPVHLANVTGFLQGVAVGPRGICYSPSEYGDSFHCLGAIPSPPAAVRSVAVSAGSDASACGVRDGGVVCWGEAYAAASSLDATVTISFVPTAPAPLTETAEIGATDPQPWSSDCRVRRGCSIAPPPTPACSARIKPRNWPDVLASARRLSGQVVSVRGPLVVGYKAMTLMGCDAPDGEGCCNSSSAAVALDGPTLLELGGLVCAGDESLACCNAPAYGQTVVATGKLARAGTPRGGDSRWTLTSVSLCTEP